MKTIKSNLMTLEEFKDHNYGKSGTEKRDKLEAGYETFKIGAMIHDARIGKEFNLKRTCITQIGGTEL